MMAAGKILFRCDADVAMGTGHVMRCMALAQAWQDAGGSAAFALAQVPEELLPRLHSQGFETIALPVAAGSSEDARATGAHARQMGAQWAVVDGDQFTSAFAAELKPCGQRIALLDDYGQRERYDVDLVVNPNFETEEEVYRRGGCRGTVVTGSEYVLLRREFRRHEERSVRRGGNRVLVTLGGSDPENLTPRVIEALARSGDLKITIVAGAGYRDRLPMLAGQNVVVKFNVIDMPAEMREADMAIAMAGGTVWELLHMGCVVVSYARNAALERMVAKLDERKVLVNMGSLQSFNADALAATVRRVAGSIELRMQMGEAGRHLVDGRGAERVVQAMQRIQAARNQGDVQQ